MGRGLGRGIEESASARNAPSQHRRPRKRLEAGRALPPGDDPEWFDLLVEHTERSGPGVPLDAEGEPVEGRPLRTTTRTIRYVFRDGRYVEVPAHPSP
jgi:hypothetical protein